ncbi:GDSL esterase/lipase At5g33370-like [Triticum aestivum]|uniref:GDSL esterase/lipase At5g33370-like n=1 Tax=Triticum aestivum TaxID=4565 RepID=UPI001D033E5F|nr:GDSL esterase/lipase At5g33370-like [Triticum aestivum]
MATNQDVAAEERTLVAEERSVAAEERKVGMEERSRLLDWEKYLLFMDTSILNEAQKESHVCNIGYSVRSIFWQENGEYLGAEPALPYLSPYTDVGILNDTGVQFVNIIRIAQQLQNFQDYQQRLAAYVGEDAARERVSQSLVLITLGGNDFVNNYYLVPFSARSQQFEIHDYVHFIISEYKKVLAGDMDDGKEASSAGLNNSGRYWIGLCRNYGKGT